MVADCSDEEQRFNESRHWSERYAATRHPRTFRPIKFESGQALASTPGR